MGAPKPTPEQVGAEFVRVLWDWMQADRDWHDCYADVNTPAQRWAMMAQENARLRAIGSNCCASHEWCDANIAMDVALRSFGIDPFDEDKGNQMSEAMCEFWNAAWEAARPALANANPPTTH